MSKDKEFKVTYTTLDPAGLESFHQAYDQAVRDVQNLFNKSYPMYIGNEEISGYEEFPNVSPIDREIALGYFQKGTAEVLEKAIKVARDAYKNWRYRDYRERVDIMRRAADLISKRKYELAALMSIEAGKSRFESMGDVEEGADLIRYYCRQMEVAQGFVKPMGQLSPNEETKSILRPFGAWMVISPFNFPLALAAGMSAGVLVAGNTAILKPSSDTPLTGLKLYEIYRDAGIPEGVVNYITGPGGNFQDVIFNNRGIAGVVFTGSSDVGFKIYNGLSRQIIRPCILEMGGKNPAIVTAHADLDQAAEGVMKSAYGLSGQKCSACSRVYVHSSVEKAFLDKLVQQIQTIKVGNPAEKDVFLGPVINQSALETFKAWADICREEGTIVLGGNVLTESEFSKGYFVEATLVKDLPKDHRIFREELFLPFLAVAPVDSLEEAVAECNKADYGLTAGIFSQDQDEVQYFLDEIETGVLYVNRRSGATTGAWPGVQSFCGWKKSGSSGKGGCGPYYVQQFLREQSHTVMK